MDFLLIGLLIFGGLMLFKLLRRNAAGAGSGHAPATAYDGGSMSPGVPPSAGAGHGQRPAAGAIGSNDKTSPGEMLAGADAPYWFDGAAFIEGAKTHFIRLQAAWDRSDFRDIREYTSPELFAELKREREAIGAEPNDTEVVTLNAELLGLRRDDDRLIVIASVRFTGLIREDASGVASPLDEIWHVAHPWASAEGDWIIIGIQQPGA